MRNFKQEEQDYNYITDFLASRGYDETHPLPCEIVLENNESCGLSSLELPWVCKIWVDMENEIVCLTTTDGCDRYLDELDGTELSCIAQDLEMFYQNAE